MIKPTHNRFPTAYFVSTQDLLTASSKIVDPLFRDTHLFPHSVLFMGKPSKPFSLERPHLFQLSRRHLMPRPPSCFGQQTSSQLTQMKQLLGSLPDQRKSLIIFSNLATLPIGTVSKAMKYIGRLHKMLCNKVSLPL